MVVVPSTVVWLVMSSTSGVVNVAGMLLASGEPLMLFTLEVPVKSMVTCEPVVLRLKVPMVPESFATMMPARRDGHAGPDQRRDEQCQR